MEGAVRGGDIDAVRGYIVDDGYDVRADRTLLFSAISRAHGEMVELLVEHGADCAATDEKGRTPLLRACALDDPSIIRAAQVMIERGADVNARDENGKTPLHATTLSERGGVTLARALLENRRLSTLRACMTTFKFFISL
jgi:ankyrin repeat protein